MSYVASYLVKKEKARGLRRQGFSIKDIERKLKISRSSASLWCRDIVLTKSQVRKLYLNKKTGSLRGSYIAAQNKIAATKLRIQKIQALAKEELGNITVRDRFVTGIALYAGEGSKLGNTVQFTNSEPAFIIFMIQWLKDFCDVPTSKLRGWVYIHDDLDEAKARRFWSKLTEIPLTQFHKSYIATKRSGHLRKQKHPYGVCRVSVNDVALLRKIKAWIAGLTQLRTRVEII